MALTPCTSRRCTRRYQYRAALSPYRNCTEHTYKLIAVTALGVPAIAVLIFEIALNGLALFNHANIRLPNAIEKPLRLILMTQILHRIHHSQVVSETNSNYGFSVIWWDKLFGSYKDKATKADADINIGLKEYSSQNQNASLLGLLTMPFKNK